MQYAKYNFNTMKTRLLFLLLGLFFAFLFIIFTYAAKKEHFQAFDFNLTVKIQNHTPKRLDEFLSFFSALASFEATSLMLAVLVLIRRRILGFISLITFIGSHVVELYGKILLDHPGPQIMFYRSGAASSFFPQWYTQPGSSYPSGHSQRIVFLAIVFIYVIINSKKLGIKTKVFSSIVSLTIVALTLYSRVSLGEHWSSDVMGGSLLGAGAGFLSLVFF